MIKRVSNNWVCTLSREPSLLRGLESSARCARFGHLFRASGRLMSVQSLELRVPPMLFGGLVAFSMWVVAYLSDTIAPLAVGRTLTAVVIALVGLAVVFSGAFAFRRARTTLNPLQPHTSAALVSSGIYEITRNPMYVGFLLVLIAWTVLLYSVWTIIGPVVFVLYISRFQIVPEERALLEKFGEDFVSYTARVPRWVRGPTRR